MRIPRGFRPRSSELITTWDGLARIRTDWDRLWQTGRSRKLCYSLRWVAEISAFFDRSGRGAPTRPWCVVMRDSSGRPTGIAPFLLVEEGRLGKRYVRTFPDWVERNHGFLCEDGSLEALAREVRSHLDRQAIDALFMRGVLRQEARDLMAAWRGSWRCSARRISATEGEKGEPGTTFWDRRAIPIPSNWDEYLRTRASSYRKNLRRGTNRAAKLGQLRFWRHSAGRQICGDPLSLEQMAAAIARVEELAWQTDRHFSPGGDGPVILEVLSAEQMLELSLLYLDDKPISYALGHAANRAATSKYIGYDPEHSELSPGLLTLAEMVRTSCEAGHVDEINLRGSTHYYKAQMADVIESSFELELTGRTARGALSALARRVRDDGTRSLGSEASRLLDEPDPAPGSEETSSFEAQSLPSG